MSDDTREPSNSEPSEESQILGLISPFIFKSLLDVIPAICKTLNWSPMAQAFLCEVLRVLPDDLETLLTIKHADLAQLLWGDVSELSGKRRIARAVSALKKDQLLSGFQAIWVELGDRVIVSGREQYLETSYKAVDAFGVIAELCFDGRAADVLALRDGARKRKMLALAQDICRRRGYQRVPARARQQPKQSATKSEAAGAVSSKVIAESRKPNENFSDDLDWFTERIYQHFIECGKADEEFRYRVKRVFHALEIAELRALETLDLHRRSKLKLVGGQPK